MRPIPSAGKQTVTLPNGEETTVDICGACSEAPVWAKGRCLKCYAKAYAQENPDRVRGYSKRRYRRFKRAKEAIEAQLAALSDDAAAVETYMLDHPDEREAVQQFFSDNWDATLKDYLEQKEQQDAVREVPED